MATNICADAAVRITMRYPFWSEIFYSMTIEEVAADDMEVQTAATDGRKMWINPKFWKTMDLDQKVAVVVHELMHKMYLHCTRMGNRDPELWNIACDHVINTLLKTNGFTLPDCGCMCDMKYNGWLAEAVYADLVRQQKEDEKSGKSSKPGEGLGKWRDIRPQQGSPEEIAKHEVEVQALVERAVANARAMGKLPAGIEQNIVEVFKAPKEPWYNMLHRYMQSLCLSEYNWAKLNRRTLITHGVFSPLHLSEALGDVAIFIDTSGSCYDRAQQVNFAGHLNAILAEARPRRVYTYYFDADVYPGEIIEAGELDVRTHPKGGGGTDFRPIFQQLEEDNIVPEVCIILTDTQGAFPSTAPEYPVVWASIDLRGRVPFGEIVYVE